MEDCDNPPVFQDLYVERVSENRGFPTILNGYSFFTSDSLYAARSPAAYSFFFFVGT
jgi:hypothetical protein